MQMIWFEQKKTKQLSDLVQLERAYVSTVRQQTLIRSANVDNVSC